MPQDENHANPPQKARPRFFGFRSGLGLQAWQRRRATRQPLRALKPELLLLQPDPVLVRRNLRQNLREMTPKINRLRDQFRHQCLRNRQKQVARNR
jgi:hypothetical protein